jgi:hypothetical protein
VILYDLAGIVHSKMLIADDSAGIVHSRMLIADDSVRIVHSRMGYGDIKFIFFLSVNVSEEYAETVARKPQELQYLYIAGCKASCHTGFVTLR